MPIWKPAPVTEEPEITLTRWIIVEAEFEEGPPSRHFVGYHGSGRVSSPIVEFDREKQRGKTRSGRIYQLSGEPAFSMQAAYTWDMWARLNKVTSWEDVSEKALQETAQPAEEKSEPTV